jgi:large subunit ribosomal protein L30
MSSERTIRVTLVKSTIGYTQDQRRTAQALGLNKVNASRVHKATPQIQGMVRKISHLLRVEEVDE